MSAAGIEVVDATQVESIELDRFLSRAFTPAKVDFLKAHGAWSHRGDEHRFLVVKDGELAAYASVIPAQLHLNDHVIPASWYVDLYVLEEYRGQRLQQFLDERVKQSAEVLLGVPNQLASTIHRRNGWGVREDWHIMLLPLRPLELQLHRRMPGVKGAVSSIVAGAATPLMSGYRARLLRRKLDSVRMVEQPDADLIAEIYAQHNHGWTTTHRDAGHIRWRFVESPQQDQLSFFVGPSKSTPSLVAIARTFRRNGLVTTRILDIFGDMSNRDLLSQLILAVVQDAARQGAVQITGIATNGLVKAALRARGFLLTTPFRFCWFSHNQRLMQAIDRSQCHWSYADSDNDFAG